jgi:YD repeat-containing protein
LERIVMKATYDRRTDTLTLVLREDVEVSESDEDKPGVILDYDADGNLVSIEVLDASKRVSRADRVELETIS